MQIVSEINFLKAKCMPTQTCQMQGCQLSRLDTISHALSPSMQNLPHECETSRQEFKIPRIEENINPFFFLVTFLKVKTDTQFYGRRREKTAKY